MLGYWCIHEEYVNFVLVELKKLAETFPESIMEYKENISKMLILNLAPLEAVIAGLYPPIGRMAERQMEIIRSFILMCKVGIPLDKWLDKLTNCPILRIIAGFTPETLVKTSSYYDFINRIVPLEEGPVTRTFKKKPKEKLNKGEKLPPKNTGVVNKLVRQAIDGFGKLQKRLSRRPERFLQRIFARVNIDSSTDWVHPQVCLHFRRRHLYRHRRVSLR